MATDCARLPPSQVINFGNALDSAARFVEAEEAYNLALNLVPSDASVYTSLAHRASLDCMQVLTPAPSLPTGTRASRTRLRVKARTPESFERAAQA